MLTISSLDVEIEVSNQDGELISPEIFMREVFDSSTSGCGLVRDPGYPEVILEAIFQVEAGKLFIGIEISDWASRYSVDAKGLESLDTSEGSIISEAVKFYMTEGEITPEFSYRITGVYVVGHRRTVKIPEEINLEKFLQYLGSVCSTEFGPVSLGCSSDMRRECFLQCRDQLMVLLHDFSNVRNASDEDFRCLEGNSLRLTYLSYQHSEPPDADALNRKLLDSLFESRPRRVSVKRLSVEVAELWHQWKAGTISQDCAEERWQTVYEATGGDIRRPYKETKRYWASSPFKERGALHLLSLNSSL